ncbi:unnamed protein product [Closterium sp. Naga37s-1]|nr:unnamed protein product [Closterium sp. Naga37s-1]
MARRILFKEMVLSSQAAEASTASIITRESLALPLLQSLLHHRTMAPRGRSAKASADAPPTDANQPEVDQPDVNQPAPEREPADKQIASDEINTALNNETAAATIVSTSTLHVPVAGSSGLSVQDKMQSSQPATMAEQQFLEDDSDEELDIDIAKDDAFRLRYTAILLIPMVLSQEIIAIIAAVRLLMQKVWCSSLTPNAGVTENIQEMTPGFVAKTRFCRLQISFLDERDAHHIKSHVFEYQKTNSLSIKCIWQHTEDPSYLKEKAAHPLAIEVLFKRVPANVVPDVLKDLLVRFKLKMRKQSAFKEGFAFHRVVHPLTGADTDVIKGLVVQHPAYPLRLTLTQMFAFAAASLCASALMTPILKDPAIALVSTGRNREEWICRQVCCGKTKGKTFMAAAEHIVSASHLLNLEKLGTATKASLDKLNLAHLKKDYGL